MIDNLGGRKFLFAMVALLSGLVICLFGKATSEAFFTFASIIGGTYVAGNLGADLINKE